MPKSAFVAVHAPPDLVMMARDDVIRSSFDFGVLCKFPDLVLCVKATFIALLQIMPEHLFMGTWAHRIVF